MRRREALLGIRDSLRDSGADVVFLQEIGLAVGSDAADTQYEVLADTVWPQHAYGRNAVTTGGHHGNAVLSKFAIASWRNVDASVGRAEPRGFLHCEVDAPVLGAPLHAICVHLALREPHRRQQVGRLVELVRSGIPRDAPLVIAGDFNDWRQRAHRRLVGELGVASMHSDRMGRPEKTFPARMPFLRLDRIYVRGLEHRAVALSRRAWSRLSDHAPLAGELWRPPARDVS
jgi:endonuclease/exonuclease/phosphatase family metal-dependent hydrolase